MIDIEWLDVFVCEPVLNRFHLAPPLCLCWYQTFRHFEVEWPRPGLANCYRVRPPAFHPFRAYPRKGYTVATASSVSKATKGA